MLQTRTIVILLLAACFLSCDQHTPDGTETVLDERTVRCTQEFGDPDSSLYVLPYPVGRTYAIIQSYCPPNPAWGHHKWLAYDFNLAIGDTVTASRAGTVIFQLDSYADATRVCGEENFVVIEHADGTVMQYVHLTTGGSLVEVGDRVQEGDPIGLSGDSGCSSGPHLHVNLLRNKSNFNAENTLPLNYRNAMGLLDARHGLQHLHAYTANAY